MSDYDVFDPTPPQGNYSVPDDPFADDLFAGILSEPPEMEFSDLPDDALFFSNDAEDIRDFPPAVQDGPQGIAPPETNNEAWSWYDARLIGVQRDTDDATAYEIGCIDLYANRDTGDLGGSYLPLTSFGNEHVAAAFYHDLQRQFGARELSADALPAFAEEVAAQVNPNGEGWRTAQPAEYAAYEFLRETDIGDLPPDAALDPLLQTAFELGGVVTDLQQALGDSSAFNALNAIGIEAEGFNPSQDPPPFFDEATGTAYWIGVFQPNRGDTENCVASILSLGRNPDTGDMEAQLAPCVPGDWDKAYGAAEYLIGVAQKGDIDRCFDTAEGMALATDQRGFWERERGLPLEPEAAQEIAQLTAHHWDVTL
jgi:hypothetical protein